MKEDKLEEELKKAIDTSNIKVKWVEDPMGYFTIKPFFSNGRVYVRYYHDNKLAHTFSGINTAQMMQEIIERNLVSRMDHAAYLGKEIEKAIIALKNDLLYVQDKELSLKKMP
jgi:tetrahydromethanopterin S-methyltransferase subunit A